MRSNQLQSWFGRWGSERVKPVSCLDVINNLYINPVCLCLNLVITEHPQRVIHNPPVTPQGTSSQLLTSISLSFADDCLIYRDIHGIEDQKSLQRDLNSLEQWGARFNATKCNIIRTSRK